MQYKEKKRTWRFADGISGSWGFFYFLFFLFRQEGLKDFFSREVQVRERNFFLAKPSLDFFGSEQRLTVFLIFLVLCSLFLIAHHPKNIPPIKSFVGFQMEVLADTWRCGKWDKNDLAFCEWVFSPFFLRTGAFHRPFSPPALDHTPSQNIPH